MLEWLKNNASTVVKAVSLTVAVGGGALGFFVSLKTDVSVLQADVATLQQQSSNTNYKVDKLYDVFIVKPFIAERDKL